MKSIYKQQQYLIKKTNKGLKIRTSQKAYGWVGSIDYSIIEMIVFDHDQNYAQNGKARKALNCENSICVDFFRTFLLLLLLLICIWFCCTKCYCYCIISWFIVSVNTRWICVTDIGLPVLFFTFWIFIAFKTICQWVLHYYYAYALYLRTNVYTHTVSSAVYVCV